MDINELESFELADAVKFHDKLNPVLWDEGNRMRPEVREALLKIAQDFQEFMGIGDFALEDITVSGSNAAYSYTPHSDIDLHLIVDQSQLNPSEVYKELFNAKKYQYNDQHDFKIKGYDVEVYVQDAAQPHESLGVYSLVKDDWKRIPTARRANLNEPTTRVKYEKLGHVIEQALRSSDYDYVDRVLDTVKKYRKAGLDEKGEFGPENLAFKALRKSGLVQQLWDHRADLKDQQLSLREKAAKPRKSWGKFNGMQFEDEQIAVNDKVIDVEQEVEKFVRYAAKFLKLKRLPKILLRGPEFSHEIHSFGHYVDSDKKIEVETTNRQIMDILRTLAHEMVHFRQHETEDVPHNAGETGSRWENEAHAVGGVIMRHWQNKHPELLQAKSIGNEVVDEGRLGKAAAAAALGTAVAAGSPPAKADWVSDIANTARAVYNAPKNYTKAGIQGEIGQELQNFVRAQAGDASAQNQSHINRAMRSAPQSTAAAGGEGDSMQDAVAAAERNAARQLGTNDYRVVEREVQPMGGGKFRAMVVVQPMVREASGYIPTRAQAKDPRFKTALTVDVHPGQTGKEANKLKLNVNSQGRPDLLIKNLRNALSESLDVRTSTPKEIAYKHGVSEKQILAQLKKGIEVEKEHTSDTATAREIALDHLGERPDYYDRLEQAERLDEVKMSPSALRSFAQSPEAKGIRIGFEAEIVFPGLGGDGEDGEYEPDYDEDTRAYSIEDIINFFEYDDHGYGLSGREADRLRNELDEAWMEYFDEAMYDEWEGQKFALVKEYIENNDWDRDEQIREYLSVEYPDLDAAEIIKKAQEATSTKDTPPEFKEADKAIDEALDARVEQSIADQDGEYDAALDEFRDGFSGVSEEDWLRENYRYMSDVADAFNLTWPYLRYDGGDEDGYDEYNAEQLADDLERTLGVDAKASGGYHSTRRDETTWIFEPDSSLEADSGDMPVEIISPPMPLDEGLVKLREFFKWAKENKAYTNDSTGFHMGVSLPIKGGNVDFLKLALFLGDEYVLKEFGRQANHFTEAAMKKIRNKIKQNPSQIGDAMTLLRNGLIELANKSLSSIVGSEKNPGFGKYTSINPKGNYIEFRSAGGEDYSEDVDKLENTLLRYARAMTIAANPAAERKEYYKKLYKLIAPSGGNPALDLFAKFASGEIDAATLKNKWAEETLAKDAPETQEKSTWAVYDTQTKQYVPGMKYSGYTESEAFQMAKQAMSPGSTTLGFRQMFKDRYELRNVSKSTGRWAIINRDTGETLEVVDSENRGDAADLAMQKYSGRGIDYYIEPVQSDEPKPKLSRRAELAQRIKGQKADEFRGLEYVILDRLSGTITDPFRATSIEQAVEKADKYAEREGKVHDFTQRYTLAQKTPDGNKPISELEFKRARRAASPGQQNSTDYKYYIKDIISGNIVHLFNADSNEAAAAYNRQYANQAGRRDQYKYGPTQVLQPEQLEQGRAAMQAAPDRVGTTAQTTLEPGQHWVIYSTSTGTSVKSLSHTDRSSAAEEARTWIRMNNGDVTNFAIRAEQNPNARPTPSEPIPGSTLDIQRQRAQALQGNYERQPQQITTDAGVPMWEIYDRRSNNAVTRFPDHNQTAAWSTAQQWLRDAYFPEDSWSNYSVRPLMQQG